MQIKFKTTGDDVNWVQVRQGAARVRQRFGRWAELRHLLHHAVNHFLVFDRLKVVVLPREHLAPAAGPSPYAVRDASCQDLQRLQADATWETHGAELQRLAQGDRCLLSCLGDEPAGCTWVHDGGEPTLPHGLRLRLPPHWLYSYAAFTHPDHRGQGLQSARHRHALAAPRWQAQHGLISYASAINFASRHGQARSGFQALGSLWLIGPARRPWVWMSPALRRFGLTVERTEAARVLPEVLQSVIDPDAPSRRQV